MVSSGRGGGSIMGCSKMTDSFNSTRLLERLRKNRSASALQGPLCLGVSYLGSVSSTNWFSGA